MSTTLEGLLERTAQFLMDASGLIYDTGMLSESVRHALSVYNRACPQVCEGEASTDEEGRTASLDALERLVDVLEVLRGSEEVRGWVQYSDGSSTCLLLARELEPGETLRVRYTRPHTLSGLDGAGMTSLPVDDESLLVRGTAGYAACSRSARRSQSFDPLPAGGVKLEAWGRAVLDEFRAELKARRPRSGCVAAWA